jgi:hypothetical protein
MSLRKIDCKNNAIFAVILIRKTEKVDRCNYLNMNIKALLKNCSNILFSPEREWIRISENEDMSVKSMMLKYYMPLLYLMVIVSIIGNYLFNPIEQKPFTEMACFVLGNFIILIINVFISALFIRLLSKCFGIKTTRVNIYKLIIYTYTAVLISLILIGLLGNYPGLKKLFTITGFYSIYLFFKGSKVILKLENGKLIKFVAVSIILQMSILSALFIPLNFIILK